MTPQGTQQNEASTKPMKIYIELTIRPGKMNDILKLVWFIKALLPMAARMCNQISGYNVRHTPLINLTEPLAVERVQQDQEFVKLVVGV